MALDGGLTPKQEAFVLAYMETSNATEAYRRCYDAKNMGEATINVKACELLKNGKVAVRLQILQAKARAAHEITIERLTDMLLDDRAQAKDLAQTATAVAAVMGLAKLHGLIVDKSQSVNLNLNFEDILRARLSRTAVDAA